jgi:hypothetical protein
MGNFSRDTFDRLKHYVSVRLQQGVPVVDADSNEESDIRRYELQAFLKWFVGEGVPQGNDGFRIEAVADANDFTIKGGDGTPDGAGRCLVDGWDVINESDLRYTGQALFDTTLASTLGVAALTSLNAPASNRTDTVYLDVWEREVDSAEDTDLINPPIGIETCVRIKREWVVRVAENAPAPPPSSPGHVHYPLAHLNRAGGETVIAADQIEDLRLTGLSMVSYHDVNQVVTDAYGSAYTLDHDGQPNLKVSLREAINAMLRGGLPGTPEEQLTPAANVDVLSSVVVDSNGDIWVFWLSNRSGNNDIWYDRYDSAASAWDGNTQLTTDTNNDNTPAAVVDNNGDIWVFWYSNRSGNNDIWYDRYDSAASAWNGNTQLTTDTNNDNTPAAVVDNNGNIWVFWYSNRSGNNDIWYDRYNAATNWQGNTQLSTSTDTDSSPRAVVGANGDIWVVWQSYNSADTNYNVWYDHYDAAAATWDGNLGLTTDLGNDYLPYPTVDSNGDIWVFWYSDRGGNTDIWYRRYRQAASSWGSDSQLTTSGDSDFGPRPMVSGGGDVWVFWYSYNSGESNYDIKYKRFTSDSGWGNTVRLTTASEYDVQPVAVEDVEGDIWAFWTRYATDLSSIYVMHQRLVPAI